MQYFKIKAGIFGTNYRNPSNMHISNRCTIDLQNKKLLIIKTVGAVIRAKGVPLLTAIFLSITRLFLLKTWLKIRNLHCTLNSSQIKLIFKTIHTN